MTQLTFNLIIYGSPLFLFAVISFMLSYGVGFPLWIAFLIAGVACAFEYYVLRKVFGALYPHFLE